MHSGLSSIPATGRHSVPNDSVGKKALGWWASIQVALIALTPMLALMPPGDGAMLIAPITLGDRTTTIRWAIGAGAKLVAPGPYAGSYVVQGSFAALVVPGLLHGALIINARFAGCGTPDQRITE